MYEQDLQELLKQHALFKKRMITGVVFVSLYVFFYALGMVTLYYIIGIFFLLLCLVFAGIGHPLLISGIINVIKYNVRINRARRNNDTATRPQPQIQPPKTEEPEVEYVIVEEPVSQDEAPSVETE